MPSASALMPATIGNWTRWCDYRNRTKRTSISIQQKWTVHLDKFHFQWLWLWLCLFPLTCFVFVHNCTHFHMHTLELVFDKDDAHYSEKWFRYNLSNVLAKGFQANPLIVPNGSLKADTIEETWKYHQTNICASNFAFQVMFFVL